MKPLLWLLEAMSLGAIVVVVILSVQSDREAKRKEYLRITAECKMVKIDTVQAIGSPVREWLCPDGVVYRRKD